MGKYIFEYDFINERQCTVTITNGSRIQETLQIQYEEDGPVYKELFKAACGLAKKLADGK